MLKTNIIHITKEDAGKILVTKTHGITNWKKLENAAIGITRLVMVEFYTKGLVTERDFSLNEYERTKNDILFNGKTILDVFSPENGIRNPHHRFWHAVKNSIIMALSHHTILTPSQAQSLTLFVNTDRDALNENTVGTDVVTQETDADSIRKTTNEIVTWHEYYTDGKLTDEEKEELTNRLQAAI